MSVRCSACQAVFSVAVSSGTDTTVPAIDEPSGWHVLRPSTGERRQVADFHALQRLIIEKGLAQDDLVSEDRTNWKRADAIDALREIFELAARVPQSHNPTSTIGHVSRSVITQRSSVIGESETTATMPGIDDLIRNGAASRTQKTPQPVDATDRYGAIRPTAPTVATNASQPLPQAHVTARSHTHSSQTAPTSAHGSRQVSQPLPTSGPTTPAPAIPPIPQPARQPVQPAQPASAPILPPQGVNHTRPILVEPAAEAPGRQTNRPPTQQVISSTASETAVRPGSPAVRLAALDARMIQQRKKSEYTLGSFDADSEGDLHEWGSGDADADDFDVSELLPKSAWKGPVTIVLLTLLAAAGGGGLVAMFYPQLFGEVVEEPAQSAPEAEHAGIQPSGGEGSAAHAGLANGQAPDEGSGRADEGSGQDRAVDEDEPDDAVPDVADSSPAPPSTPAAAAEPPAGPTPAPARVRLDFDGQMSRGERAMQRGDYDEALEAFGAAADISNRAEPHVGAAEAYERMGRSDLALFRYRRAVAANERYVPAWAGLAAVQERLGDSEALRTWRHVESIARDSRTRARALDAISRLAR